jgi:hypothetical protein
MVQAKLPMTVVPFAWTLWFHSTKVELIQDSFGLV